MVTSDERTSSRHVGDGSCYTCKRREKNSLERADKIPFGHRNSCKIPFPLSNMFGKIIQFSQIEHRQPGIPRKFSNFRKFLNDSQLCKGKLPLLRCTFLNASQYRNFPYRQSFKLKLAALMADFVWPASRRFRRHQAQMQGLLCGTSHLYICALKQMFLNVALLGLLNRYRRLSLTPA